MSEHSKAVPNLVSRLLELDSMRWSGVVRVQSSAVKKQLVVDAGLLAFAESSVPEEHLARIMVQMTLISRTLLPQITAAMKAGKSSDEAILQAAKLETDVVAKGVREQAIIIIGSLLCRDDYSVQLFRGEGLVKRELNARLPLPQLLLQAARRAAKQGTLYPALRSMDCRIVPGETKGLMDLPLDSTEAYAHSLVQEPTRLGDLLNLLPEGDSKGLELIRILLLLGLLRLEQEEHRAQRKIENPSAKANPLEVIDEMLARFEIASLYEILGVPQDASDAAIKEAYHALARQYHSDRFQSKELSDEVRDKAGRLFTYITGAYTTLSGAADRANYNETLHKERSKAEPPKPTGATPTEDPKLAAEAIYRAGRLALQKGETEKGINYLKECVWLRPDVAKYQHHLGVALAENPRKLREAEQYLQKAIGLDFTRVESHIALGKLYIKANLTRRAEQQLLNALRWDPTNAEATNLLNNLGGATQPHGPAKRR